MKKIIIFFFLLLHNIECLELHKIKKILISERAFIKAGEKFWRYSSKDHQLVEAEEPPADLEYIDLKLKKINNHDIMSQCAVRPPNNKDYIYLNGRWLLLH